MDELIDPDANVQLRPFQGWEVRRDGIRLGDVFAADFGFMAVCDACEYECGFEGDEAATRDQAVRELLAHLDMRPPGAQRQPVSANSAFSRP